MDFLLAELPEPMVFDMVHSLGVEAGAFEANVLTLFPLNDEAGRGIDWAPGLNGVPTLAGALARFDCEIQARHPAGDRACAAGS